MIRHHPAPELLADWARGGLHAGAMLAVGCHVCACSICRRDASLWEDLGGSLLAGTPSAPLSEGALERAMARLDETLGPVARTPRTPAYLRRFDPPAPLLAQKIGMRRWVTPNIWFAPIAVPSEQPVRTYLVYARRNTTLARHTHVGREFTSVLHGSFADTSGTYGPGDFAETDDSIVHAPAVTQGSGCLCLVSADAPMRLTGLPARAIQALAGMLY